MSEREKKRRRKHRPRRKHWGRRIFFTILFLLLCLPIAAWWLVASDEPTVLRTESLTESELMQARRLLDDSIDQLKQENTNTTLTFTEKEINGILASLNEENPDLLGHANIAEFGMEGVVTYMLPEPIQGKYLNMRIGLEPTNSGISIDSLSLGSLEFTGDTARSVFRILGDFVAGEEIGTKLIERIKAVSFQPDQVSFHITTSDNSVETTAEPTIQSDYQSLGSASLTWQKPDFRENDPREAELAGYRIYYGTEPGKYTKVKTILDPNATSYKIRGLPKGTWYFSVVSINKAGTESSPSNEAAKAVE